MARVLLVEDDPRFRKMLRAGLAAPGVELEEAANGRGAVGMLDRQQFDVVLTDLRMGDGDGLSVLRHTLALQPQPALILMSGHGTIEIAVEAIKAGAFDFVAKPFELDVMRLKIARALEFRRLRRKAESATDHEREDSGAPDRIIGSSGSLRRVLATVDKVAKSNATVLIRGETGTGKELIASAIHYRSARADEAFVKVNCAALHENLLESELFGHEKGAFTSADRLRIGRFELADGGTLFLDEIGDMSPSTQAKVLRVLQEREFERLGGTKTLRVDVRLVTATHRPLENMIATKAFREDLFYRLNVVSIHMPPLRDRKDDIPALTDGLLRRLSGKLKRPASGVTPEALGILTNHPWPGNIRELENVLERAMLLADGPVIQAGDLSLVHR